MSLIPYSVYGPYESLVHAFDDVCTLSNGSVHMPKTPAGCFSKRDKDAPMEFKFRLHCKGWNERGNSSKPISIVLEIEEALDPDGKELISSTVRVNYCHFVDGALDLAQAYHFDFSPPKHDHAAYHAQVTNQPIELDEHEVEDLKLSAPLRPSTHHQLRTARIPTADMTLASVLLCLVADHVGGPQFQEFYAQVKVLQTKLPQPQIEALKRSLGLGCQDVRSTHWFAHQFQ